MKVWITKHALTAGIEERDDVSYVDADKKMIGHDSDEGWIKRYICKPHWHLNREAAVVRAEKMRQKKIASLRKQLAKIENLNFGGLE